MFKIQFEIDNAAFVDGFSEEVERILSKIAQRVKDGETQGVIFDLNGQRVGNWSW
ncbi:MAG: hypothetical protein ACRC6M_02470 [Microcystaceae cyanobacterium]